MSVELWMREEQGDYNYEQVFDTVAEARAQIKKVRTEGGYWVNKQNDLYFIPWHQVELVTIRETEN
jgi:hypothetical protein